MEWAKTLVESVKNRPYIWGGGVLAVILLALWARNRQASEPVYLPPSDGAGGSPGGSSGGDSAGTGSDSGITQALSQFMTTQEGQFGSLSTALANQSLALSAGLERLSGVQSASVQSLADQIARMNETNADRGLSAGDVAAMMAQSNAALMAQSQNLFNQTAGLFGNLGAALADLKSQAMRQAPPAPSESINIVQTPGAAGGTTPVPTGASPYVPTFTPANMGYAIKTAEALPGYEIVAMQPANPAYGNFYQAAGGMPSNPGFAFAPPGVGIQMGNLFAPGTAVVGTQTSEINGQMVSTVNVFGPGSSGYSNTQGMSALDYAISQGAVVGTPMQANRVTGQADPNEGGE